MGRNDWYRRTTWSSEDREAFHARLSRSRGSRNKAQYARIQALCLAKTGDEELVRSAMGLLDLIVAEWPEPSELPSVHWQYAQCHERLADPAEAAAAYRRSLAAEEAKGSVRTGAWKDFLWMVAGSGLAGLYDEVLEIAETRQHQALFPRDRFRIHAARALIHDERNQLDVAATEAALALDAAAEQRSGFRHHQSLGLVGDDHGEVRERLERLAAGRGSANDRAHPRALDTSEKLSHGTPTSLASLDVAEAILASVERAVSEERDLTVDVIRSALPDERRAMDDDAITRLLLKAACATAADLERTWSRVHPDDGAPSAALEATRAWLVNPSAQHAARGEACASAALSSFARVRGGGNSANWPLMAWFARACSWLAGAPTFGWCSVAALHGLIRAGARDVLRNNLASRL